MKTKTLVILMMGLAAVCVPRVSGADIPPFEPGPFPEDPLIYNNLTPGWLDPRVALPQIPDIPPPGGVRWWLSDDQARYDKWPQGWMQQDGFLRDGWIPKLGALEERWYLLTDVHWWGTYGYYTGTVPGEDPFFHADSGTEGKIPVSGHQFDIELVKLDDSLVHLTLLDGVEALWGYAPPEPGPLLGGLPPTEPEDQLVPVYGYAAHVDPVWICTCDLKGIRIALKTFGDPDNDTSYWYWVTSQYEASELTPPNVHEAYQGDNLPLGGWAGYNDDLAFQLTGVPEPATMVALLGLGGGIALGKRLRRGK